MFENGGVGTIYISKYTSISFSVCIMLFIYVTTESEKKRSNEFERVEGRIHNRGWKERKEEENDVIIL